MFGAALVAAACAACEQPVTLPQRGAAAADVRRLLGEPSIVENRSDDSFEMYVTDLQSCPRDKVKNAEVAWAYEWRPFRDVIVLLDAKGSVVCAEHGGMTFVH